MNESELSKLVQDYLESLGFQWFWRNQVYSGRVKSGAYLHTGKKGIADIILIAKNKTIYLELKTATGKQSHEQKLFQKHCEKHNQPFFIIKNLEDLTNYLKSV
jgi:hypothetical protein